MPLGDVSTVCGIGLFELIVFTLIFAYICHNAYKLWEDAHKGRRDNER